MLSPLRKYVVIRDASGQEHPIIFPPEIQHNLLVPAGTTPVSAGFLFIYEGNTFAHSMEFGSDSLGLSPRPEDKTILKQLLTNS
jgi:hypothetical protein